MSSEQQNESTNTSLTRSTSLNRTTSLTRSETDPKLCLNGCGFFGSPSNMDLCSKCYRSKCGEKSQTTAAKAAVKNSLKTSTYTQMIAEELVIPKLDTSGSSSTAVSTAVSGVIDEGEASKATPPPPPNRCNCCNKKVRLMGFKCKCGSTFCSVHRYPESHECSHNFKEAGREAIAKANPLLKADKLERL